MMRGSSNIFYGTLKLRLIQIFDDRRSLTGQKKTNALVSANWQTFSDRMLFVLLRTIGGNTASWVGCNTEHNTRIGYAVVIQSQSIEADIKISNQAQYHSRFTLGYVAIQGEQGLIPTLEVLEFKAGSENRTRN